jgi:hypothetical protein
MVTNSRPTTWCQPSTALAGGVDSAGRSVRPHGAVDISRRRNCDVAVRSGNRLETAHERPLEEIARKDWSLERAESQAIFNDKAAHPWPAPQPPKRST